QYIRGSAIIQLLLGNIGRPGGGILALRGHASIQGSTDIPTLFNLLPGYLPMPKAGPHESLDDFVAEIASPNQKGFWTNAKTYTINLLRAWWGDAATAENDYAFDYLPRLTGDHGTYATVMSMLDDEIDGYFLLGQNPAVGSAHAKMQRLGLAHLKWLVVRDLNMIESATFWKDAPEIETGELTTTDIETEVFFFPAAAHTEKDGSFTNTNRMLQWHHAAVEPTGDARSDLWFMYHLGRLVRERLSGSTEARDLPIQRLTWDYPTSGELAEPSAEAVLAEINGFDAQGKPLAAYTQLKDDGSTSCGCWIYCGVYADGVNQAARRKPAAQQNWLGPEWGWAWPANRRVLYNRASADPSGRPWSKEKRLVWWDEDRASWTGDDVPDFVPDKRPDYEPPGDATGPDALSGTEPFIMQADGRGWLYVPSGVVDGPLPTHYEPQDSPVRNPLYPEQSRNPARGVMSRPENLYHPDPAAGDESHYPFVVTTYRLTEHFTAGGMTRWSAYLSELQPEFFCEVSPELAELRGLRHAGWATVVTARGAIEARVMVTSRIPPLQVAGRTIHQIGLPFHWGPNGLSRGDAANELTAVAMDPTAHIQEDKALTADIQPGRRPTGHHLPEFVQAHRRRAGVDQETGTGV
ncbi:MAG: molybdopterin-dependent oxidoreductase, partial [Actinomycetota bacterium]|nr:molybdopterin-dependent oxidoreductase [Actinomycetota bacterium]